MVGLVDQLQSDALDHTVPVSTLLRKVKVCAAKLNLEDALSWVDSELSGYTCPADELPSYRKGHGITIGQDEFGRWLPLTFDRHDLATQIAAVWFREPVSNYQDLMEGKTKTFDLPIDLELAAIIRNVYNLPVLGMRNKISRGQIHQIVEKVRDSVLDWSLELARAGVRGEGMSFSENERAKVSGSQIHIGTFNGTFSTGDASGEGATISQSYTATGVDAGVVAQLIDAVQTSISDDRERDIILSAAREIAAAQNKAGLLKGYERLIAAAANHMTVIAPYLPALGKMLAG